MGDDGTVTLHIDVLCVVVGVVEGVVVHLGAAAVRPRLPPRGARAAAKIGRGRRRCRDAAEGPGAAEEDAGAQAGILRVLPQPGPAAELPEPQFHW